ncbi:hypothetical protein [Desulfobacterium sp. N47]|uniref:hypothetical protein n=1 Tax=Desulfobacterium sp. N47 TaxID=3115210 RepID=UPI003C8F760C
MQCEECLEKCLQHIDIPEFLEKVVREIEGDNLKQLESVAKEAFMKALYQE